MLTRLTRSFRVRAAIFLAVAYAFCVLAPHAALAFADAASAVHCLGDHGPAHVHQQDGVKPHHHADGAEHQHASHQPSDSGATPPHSDSDGKAQANCCGLFCLTALPCESLPTLAAPALHASIGSSSDYGLASRGPDRINRPPIA
jgi:hypothetical protein